MNETDIKKCIKHGYAWSSCGDKTEKTSTKDYTRSQLKTFEGLHATKADAQFAIGTRREDAPANDHAEVKCDMPETLMLNGKLHKRLAEGEPREIGDVPVDGSQTNRFGSVYYRPIAETPEQRDAESALAKANPAPTEPEHKFPEIPAWCPPLLEGDVPLGFGHAFKGINGEIIKGLHASFTSINGSEEWNIDEIWSGTDSLKFYCSPRTSAVALLNYPWLAEEDKAEPVNTSDKWIERKKDEYPSPTDEWTWSATLGDQVPSSVLRMPDGGEDSYNAGREWVYSDCTRSQVPAFKVGYRSYDGTVLRARYRNPNYKEPTPVASHETPIGETQPKEVSTDETQPDESEPKGHILDALGWGVAQHRRIFETGAVRDIDAGKPRIDLIAPEALIALGNVLAEGAKHYGERNWEKGIPLSQFLASMMRHYVAVQMGDHTENHDEKMLWNAMAFVATASRINAGKLPATLDDIGWTKEAHALTDAALALAKGIDPETKPDPMAANPHCSAVHVETNDEINPMSIGHLNGEKANG